MFFLRVPPALRQPQTHSIDVTRHPCVPSEGSSDDGDWSTVSRWFYWSCRLLPHRLRTVLVATQPNKSIPKHTKTFFLATNEWCASDFFMELSPFCAAQFLKLIPLLFNPHWENWIGLVWRNCHRIPMHLMVNKDGFMQLVFQNDYAFEREHIRSSSYLPAFRYLWSPASWW